MALGMCVLLFGCGPGVASETSDAETLIAKIDSQYNNENYMGARDNAEIFVVRFPGHPQVDMMRLKLLDSCLQTSRFKMATTIAERLLEGTLLKEEYREDVEYYLILSKLLNNQQWMGRALKEKMGMKFGDEYVFRNQEGMLALVDEINLFISRYPNSQYTEELQSAHLRIRENLAFHELSIAHYYAKKGNFAGARQRLELYEQRYLDLNHPLYDILVAYPELV